MAVHDLLRELVETRGAGVVGDADQFRGALDDFLDENEATRGEINLLVDAVRLGAVNRVVTMLDHGADPGAAIAEVAVELARDRGADSATGARWALGVIGFALGKVPADLLGAARPSSIPTPAQRPVTASPPPSVPDLSTEPTDPPSHPSFPRPESTPTPPPTPPPAPPPAPPPEPERTPAPPTNLAGDPPERPGTTTLPEHATERVPDSTPAAPAAPPAPPAPSPGPPPFQPASPAPSQQRGRGRLVAVLVAVLLVVAAGVAAFLLLSDGDDPDTANDDTGSSEEAGGDSATPGDSLPTLPATAVVLPVTVDDVTSLYVLDTADRSVEQLTDGPDDRLASISPDRTTVLFLRPAPDAPGRRAPFLLEVGSGEERPLFGDSSPCAYAGRGAWSPSGDGVVFKCLNAAGEYVGTHVVGLDGQEQAEVIPDGIPDGGITFNSESTLIYARGDGSGAPSTLWQYDLGDGSSTQLTAGPGSDSRPDWSEENGVALFFRSPDDGPEARGELWTWSPSEGETLLDIGQPVKDGALSGDGSLLLYLVDTDNGVRLASSPYSDPSDVTVYEELPGEPGAPAGGTL